jgi:hypothetical protein
VKRQEIPKSGGGVRELGIPTVLDRFIQQAILQELQPRFDPTFSEHSHGFRPGRGAHDAVREAQRYIGEGRRWVVDVDLEKFFDRVNHEVLMGKLGNRISDRRMLRIIRRYLEAGVMANQITEELRSYIRGWKEYFRLAATPGIFGYLDKWLHRRPRAVQLRQWKQGATTYRELRSRGVPERLARAGAAHAYQWWRMAAHGASKTAMPNQYFDKLGIPRLTPH